MSADRDSAGYGSGKWVRTRTDAELQEMIDGNMPGNHLREDCLAEQRYREAGRDRAQEMRWIKATFAATVVLGVLAIVATFIAP